MDITNSYEYEIELKDGTIIKRSNEFNPKDVVRISYMSRFFPRHDIIFTDFKLVKRFSRVFIGINSKVKERLHCVITNKFRFYLKSGNGSVIITEKDYELYL